MQHYIVQLINIWTVIQLAVDCFIYRVKIEPIYKKNRLKKKSYYFRFVVSNLEFPKNKFLKNWIFLLRKKGRFFTLNINSEFIKELEKTKSFCNVE